VDRFNGYLHFYGKELLCEILNCRAFTLVMVSSGPFTLLALRASRYFCFFTYSRFRGHLLLQEHPYPDPLIPVPRAVVNPRRFRL
jgi:hypothetical protein